VDISAVIYQEFHQLDALFRRDVDGGLRTGWLRRIK
jgi:hypothetical protein